MSATGYFMSKNELQLYIDGASKGNPGHSGIGVIILKDGQTVKNLSHYIGKATNNAAEYTALIFGLQEGLLLKAEELTIYTDSELLYKQVNGLYKVRDANIACLYNQAMRLMKGFKKVSVNHIPREQNSGADKLATIAVKEALKRA